jgi:predicted DNA-binding transcriptional regulator AlpA
MFLHRNNAIRCKMSNMMNRGGDPSPPSIEALLTEREAAELLTLSLRTLQTYRENGTGPAYVQFGRRVAYEPASIRTWLDARKRRSTSALRGVR